MILPGIKKEFLEAVYNAISNNDVVTFREGDPKGIPARACYVSA